MTSRPDSPRPPPRDRRRRWFLGRTWAVALVTFRQGLRMRLGLLVPVAVVILVLADLSSPRFDPVFEGVPAAVSTSLLVMTVLAVVVGVFFATYSLPAEIESKVAHSVATKPVSALEIVAGKTAGMSLLVLAMLGAIAACAYVYITWRGAGLQALAARRLEEVRPRAAYPADLNALEAAARNGPLVTYRYRRATAGPDTAIDLDPASVPPPDARWVLGETGMRLVWDLAGSPLVEWVASAPCRLRLALDVRRPPDAPSAPAAVTISLYSPGYRTPTDAAAPGAPVAVYHTVAEVPASGEVEIALVRNDVPPAKGVINVPPEGELALEVMANKAGHLVGARAGAVRILGPTGQTFTVKAAPEVRAAQERGRVMLVGRSHRPRQAAVFRFDDVPARLGRAGDIAVEIGFSLDAWSPAMVPPAAEVAFVRPDTGERRTMPFSPEGHHATVVYLDRAFWHGGPLEVRLGSLTDDNFMGLVPDSVRLRLDGGPFAIHLAKATLGVWLFGTVLAAGGVLFSTRVSWFVGILATIVFFLLGFLHDYVIRWTVLGDLGRVLARWADGLAPWSGWPDVFRRVVVPLPDLRAFLPDEAVAMGQVMSTAALAAEFGWAALSVAVLVVLGAILLRNREVAA